MCFRWSLTGAVDSLGNYAAQQSSEPPS